MFAFRLCLALGYPHPDVLLAGLSARQLLEWRAFFAIDPWGEQRADRRTALLGSLLASVNGKKIEMSRLMLYRDPAELEAERRAQAVKMRAWFEEKVKTGKEFQPKLRWR